MKPALSRSCKVEQALIMSLGNWEGKACVETEPEELPEKVNGSVLRVTGDCWRISASFCHSAGGRFFLAEKNVSRIFLLNCV